ncbi:MAG: hypothetical protein IMY72_06855 [Bacteroidetes bacterium]|nr:hypothetical protein [Bacteroidota bacterium]
MKKTKFYIITAIAGLLISIIFFNSCQKEEILKTQEQKTVSPQNNIRVVKGMLIFKNQQVFQQTLTNPKFNNRIFREEWGKNIGFTSQASIYDKINDEEIKLENKLFGKYDENLSLKELSDLGVKIGHTEIYNKYLKKGLIKENKETDGSQSFDLTLKENENFVNEDGLLMIDSVIYLYQKNEIKILTDGNLGKIDLLKKTQTTNKKLNIYVLKTINSLNKSGNTNYNEWVNKKDWKHDGSKKRYCMVVYGSSYLYMDGMYMKSTFYLECKAQKKSWGRWKYKNNYMPLCQVDGNWTYWYTVENENCCSDWHYATALSDNDSKSPLHYYFGHSNYTKFYLKPNGVWHYGSPWRFMNSIHVNQFYFNSTFWGGSHGRHIIVSK